MFDIDVSMIPVSFCGGHVCRCRSHRVQRKLEVVCQCLAPCVGSLAGANPVNKVIQLLTDLEFEDQGRRFGLTEFTKNLLLGARRSRTI